MFSYFLFVALLATISGYPYKLPCNRDMTPGSVIMGNPAKRDDLRSVQVLRNGAILSSGDTFVSGETLTVQISTISTTTGLFKFMFQATGGALFQTGNILCNGMREYNLGDGTLGPSQLRMPTTPNTQVNIWVAWATQFGNVYISKNFTLTNVQSVRKPSFSPTFIPSIQPLKQQTSTNNPTVIPSAQTSKQPTYIPLTQPSKQPSAIPTKRPTVKPSSQPLKQPTYNPTKSPTVIPSAPNSKRPTSIPTKSPVVIPSAQPSKKPSSIPTKIPTVKPSAQPSKTPTAP